MRKVLLAIGWGSAILGLTAEVGMLVWAQTQVTQPQATKLGADQIKLRILTIEWSKCQASGPPPTPSDKPWDCNGIELYRFRMSDGTIRGPFLAVPAPPDFVKDAKWVDQTLVTP